MEIQSELLRVALLGTERQAPVLPAASGALGGVLSALKPEDREGTLLSAVAAISIFRRAGKLPESGGSSFAPAEKDVLPRCDRIASGHLGRMLGGEHKQVLPEWLAALAAAKRRVPEERLPALLEAGEKDVALRQSITPVLGKRGLWMAAQNPDWSFAVGDSSESVEHAEDIWEHGDKAARVALVSRWRSINPAQARAFVESTWAQDDAADRALFIEAFAMGLSHEDEPFLENALDDKRKEVRQSAAKWLALLPESRFVKRMIARLEPLLKFEADTSNLLSASHKIELTLPAECDKSMLRDGLLPKPPATEKTLGEKAFWTLQLLSAIPPSHWCARWKIDTQSLFYAMLQSQWRPLFEQGMANAAARFKDIEWASMFLNQQALDNRLAIGLIELLPPDACEARALEIVRRRNPHLDEFTAVMLSCRAPWSPMLSRVFLLTLKRCVIQTLEAGANELKTALKDFALRLSPTVARDAAEGWNSDSPAWSYWRKAIDEMNDILQFRYDMMEALKTQ